MQEIWQQYLHEQGARCDNPQRVGIHDFGHQDKELEAAESDIISDLSHYRLIPVRGEDAAEFLHNQLGVDCRNWPSGQSRLTAWCNPKGRALALFRVFRHKGEFYLRLPARLADPVRKRLSMFILRSKVSLDDPGEPPVHIGISGPGAADGIQKHTAKPPDQPGKTCEAGALTIMRVPGPQPRFELVGSSEAVIDLWSNLTPQYRPVGEPVWRLLEVLSGLPEVHPETSEAFVPQMLNLHWLGGIDFRKGCYPGQEVVARIHYRGGLKRRLYLLDLDSGTCPVPGSAVKTTGEASNAGSIVQAARTPESTVKALAVLRSEQAQTGKLALEDGSPIRILELPYATPSRASEAQAG